MFSVVQSLLRDWCSVNTITCMEVRGQLDGLASLLPLCGSCAWTRVINLGSKHIDPLSHLLVAGTFTEWVISVAPTIVLWCYHPRWQPAFISLPGSPVNLTPGHERLHPVQVASLNSAGLRQACLFHLVPPLPPLTGYLPHFKAFWEPTPFDKAPWSLH